jgi:hypothetical protein
VFRRRYLACIGAAGLAGCSGLSSDEDSTETPADRPESPVIQHYEALDDNDIEAANAAIHSESPRGELSDQAVEMAKKNDYSIDSIETFDGDTDTPEVAVSVTATNTETDEENILDLRIEVTKDDGTWKMYQIV